MGTLTNKDVEFLSNPDLINILHSVLRELDIVGASQTHRSTTYLAVSAIEGIFGELLNLLNLTPTTASWWPKDHSGKPKDRSKLTLDDRAKILENESALPTGFEKLYDPVRVYRNYMHPERELKELSPIAQSVAQLALACLNALIEKYSPQRFAANQIWQVEHGFTKILSNSLIQISPKSAEKHSVLVSERPASAFREITFDVLMPPDTIFNFLFNYSSLDSWRAARIDARDERSMYAKDAGLLFCNHWPAWSVIGRYVNEPKADALKHSVVVKLDSPGTFSIVVDGEPLALQRKVEWGFDRGGRIGFMGELGPISIDNLDVEVR